MTVRDSSAIRRDSGVDRSPENQPNSPSELERTVRNLLSREGNDRSSAPVPRDRGDGKPVTEVGPDGAKYTYDWVQKDGKLTARLKTYEKDGVTRDFKHDDAADPFKVTEWTDKIKACYDGGKEIVTVNKRVGDTNTFKSTDNTGREETRDNVRIENGKVHYEVRPADEIAAAMDRLFGKTELVAGDLQGAKERLIEAARGRVWGSSLGAHLDRIMARFDAQRAQKIRTPTEDDIAHIFDSATKVLSTTKADRHGAAHKLEDSDVAKTVKEYLYAFENPKKGLYQMQVGSCLLHSLVGYETIAFGHKLGQLLEGAYINGRFKGHAFNDFDLKGDRRAGGQNSWNHLAVTWHAWAGGVTNHVTTGYRGTTTEEGNRALTRMGIPKLHWRHLGDRISKSRYDDGNKIFGVLTYGDSHAQLQVGDFLYNWWNDPRYPNMKEPSEGRLSRRQMNLS